jgi:protein SCO1/2
MKWLLALGLLTLVLLGALAAAFGLMTEDSGVGEFASSRKYRGSQPPAGLRLPSFSLRAYSGETVRSADLSGKVVLITFLDSQCNEACPIIAAQIARTVDGLAADDRAAVEPIAISTDPREDTVASVREFLARQGAVGRLRYLTRPMPEISTAWKSFKILSSQESGSDTLHSAPVRIYDPQGFWVSTLHAGVDLSPSNLAHDIGVALEESKGERR